MNKNELVCGVTGLRSHKLKWEEDENHKDCIALKQTMYDIIESLITCGYSLFLSGMANGIDAYFSKIVLELKEKYQHIKLYGVVPHLGQELKWSLKAQVEYKEILSQCDKVIVIQDNYTPDCFKKRNAYIVENCDALIAVINDVNELRSGSSQTARMAIKQGKTILEIDPNITLKDILESLNKSIELHRRELNECIEKYGINNSQTLLLSTELDLLLNEYAKYEKI